MIKSIDLRRDPVAWGAVLRHGRSLFERDQLRFDPATPVALSEIVIGEIDEPVTRDMLSEHEKPDLSDFGPYVIVKPDVGARGATVKVVRKDRVRWKPPAFVSDACKGSPDLLVQEFIYTGPWPVSYRVQTLFGEALACLRMQADTARTPLHERYGFRESGGGRTIVATSKGCSSRAWEDKELIGVAERAHAVFPECEAWVPA